MLKLNTLIKWRTNGRGVSRKLTGTVVEIVLAGKLSRSAEFRAYAPHSDVKSNRDRYLVELKRGQLAWANVKTAVEATEQTKRIVKKVKTCTTKRVIKKIDKHAKTEKTPVKRAKARKEFKEALERGMADSEAGRVTEFVPPVEPTPETPALPQAVV